MSDLLTIEQRNKRRLAKVHKLKQENKTLSSQRKISAKKLKGATNNYLLSATCAITEGKEVSKQYSMFIKIIDMLTTRVFKLSEKIGKNSAKIEKLRTLINQNKHTE